MESLLSSPARLTSSEPVQLFQSLFCRHGALGRRHDIGRRDLDNLTEVEKLRVVPLVFGLMPREALRRRTSSEAAVKPIIERHLSALGVTPEPILMDILKSTSDQYVDTARDSRRAGTGKRKMSVGDLKASNFRLYSEMMKDQNHRCSSCGAIFTGECSPTLDHVVPFRLIGDVPDGANYQLMCSACNSAKGSFLSALQSAQWLNWVYEGQGAPIDGPNGQTRFVMLSQFRVCSHPGCAATRRDSEMHVVWRNTTGLAVADHLTVKCGEHLG